MNGENDFVYGTDEAKPTNIVARMGARDREGEADKAKAELADASRHVSVGEVEAGPDARGAALEGLIKNRPQERDGDSIAQLSGRQYQDENGKPALDVKPNYVGGSGVGSGSLRPNTPDGKIIDGVETLDD
jgi:hypothetical protein